jgi:hypothetical protein
LASICLAVVIAINCPVQQEQSIVFPMLNYNRIKRTVRRLVQGLLARSYFLVSGLPLAISVLPVLGPVFDCPNRPKRRFSSGFLSVPLAGFPGDGCPVLPTGQSTLAELIRGDRLTQLRTLDNLAGM